MFFSVNDVIQDAEKQNVSSRAPLTAGGPNLLCFLTSVLENF